MAQNHTAKDDVTVEWMDVSMDGQFLQASHGKSLYQFTVHPKTGEGVQDQDSHLNTTEVCTDAAPNCVVAAVQDKIDKAEIAIK